MVLQNRLEYGFDGYHVPPTPRAPRSARKRVSSWKKNMDHDRMGAFELLATVAGKLLLEGDDSVNKINNEEVKVVNDSVVKTETDSSKANVCDQESYNKSFFVSEIIKATGITVSDCKIEDVNCKQTETEVLKNEKPPVVNNLDCDLKLVIRDDDENSCGHIQPDTIDNKTVRGPTRIGDRRIRRLSASKQWKVAPNTEVYRNKKSCFSYQRLIREYPFKKQRLYQTDKSSISNNKCDSIEDGSSLGANDQDSHVKLKIKSFRVPEFFIEIPETATVSSLKRTVMEAVTAIFSGELHVGLMLQGKRIRDDDKTLLQTDQPLTMGSEHEILEDDKSGSDSRALVTVPAKDMGALAVVPVSRSKGADVAQRRIRRPFSVSEVEALVEAVEKLGTGRWRDVKLRAFDDANHRTYVDLKDKWKTLVHTARILPHQRRGEPVPQILLDRVLAAHGYWSHHQAKNQFKHQLEAQTCRQL
ncbi:hypothetical protein QVD17_00619 [Tagetes erecta]|uniref:Uncharacterized protein n=1 Tax=Tagetes erecta TaxID=13708 RepID=A0AAD8P0Q1_TARER|nr:hypothetical protein QVD17_00619 [Tagetes erecta]